MSRVRKKRILVTNDDGYFSDGIRALFAELKKKFVVYLVAPDREQSASSHSLTLSRPLRIQQLDARQYTTDGTPTDCVMLAMHYLFKKTKPDMIVSGINHGANMGDDVTYSGTVAAAIEGSILKVPSVAISMANWEPGVPMARAARFAARLLGKHAKLGLKPDTFLNVNFPVDTGRPYERFEFTTLGARLYKDTISAHEDPRGNPYYWIGGRPSWRTTKGSDFEAVNRGVVSITPLSMDITDRSALHRLTQNDLAL
jgi:5'-nucleotidase